MAEEKDEGMRLDKFLKVSRLIKRRTVAADAADAGRIKVNDKVAKASTKVHSGDVIEIGFGNRTVRAKVKEIMNTTKKENVADMFDYI
jgi:ribosomal 50S subunit-recycling heat shock protein